MTSTYRPWLDGVRGVAVLLVVWSHSGLAAPSDAGALGVSVFFALSGYLITGLLLDEHARTGRIALRAFYLRRTARLLPALLLLVAVCDLLYVLAGHPEVLVGSVLVLLYAANYAAVATGDYLPGYEHAWSLAVEEHFYLLWPLVLVLMLPRRPLASLVRWTLVVCVAALVWRIVLTHVLHGPWLLTYHGTLERADALLPGCAAALAVRAGWRPPRRLAGCGAAGLLAVLAVDDRAVEATLTPAFTALAATALVLGLDSARGPLRSLLSFPPLVRVGLVSYGIYLWHLPLVLLAYYRSPLPAPATVLLAVTATALVATASYRWVERPLRTRVALRLRETAARGDRVPVAVRP